jgi:predicted component of type VI protein secretion system
MKLKLVVLAGAKQDLEIPLKKEKFLIGRAKECALRAGSEAISRRHCAILRHADGYTVRDLGSRNGTHVNDVRITAEVPLKAGDELRVGPLKFRVAAIEKSTAPAPAPAENDSKRRKQPPVKGVADVAQRTMSMSDSMTEDDVSRWLLGVSDVDGPETLKETRSLRAEDTTMTRSTPPLEKATLAEVPPLPADADADDAAESATAEQDATEEEGGSGVWKFFKRGNKTSGSKKQPGKLPPRQEQQSKDSREAAADILREMTRRR